MHLDGLTASSVGKSGSEEPSKKKLADNQKMLLMSSLEVEEARIENPGGGRVIEPTPEKLVIIGINQFKQISLWH